MAYSPRTFEGWGTSAATPDDNRDETPPSPATRAHEIMTGGMPYVSSLRHRMQHPPHLDHPRMTADHVLLGHTASPGYSSYQHSRGSSQLRGTVREIADADASTIHSSDSSEGLMLPPLRRCVGREEKRRGIVFRPNELVSADEAFIMAREADGTEAEKTTEEEKRKFVHRASSAASVVVSAGRNVKRRLSAWFRKDSALSASDEEKLVQDEGDVHVHSSTATSEGLISAQIDGAVDGSEGRPPSYRPGREAEAQGRRERAHTRASNISTTTTSGYRKNRFSRNLAETPEHLRPKLSDHETVTNAQLQEMLELHVGEAHQRGRLDESAIASRFAKACGNCTNARDQAVVSDGLRSSVTENKIAEDRTWRQQEKLRRAGEGCSGSKRRRWGFGGRQRKLVAVSSSTDMLLENYPESSQEVDQRPNAPVDEIGLDWREAARVASNARMWGLGGTFY